MPDEPDALRAEVERLQRLVGPNEQSYLDLRGEVSAAGDAAMRAEAAAGVLRGEIAELHVHLARARQEQYYLQRMLPLGLGSLVGRLGRAGRSIRARLR